MFNCPDFSPDLVSAQMLWMPLWRTPLGVPRRHTFRPLANVYIAPSTGIETSLDAARTSACTT